MGFGGGARRFFFFAAPAVDSASPVPSGGLPMNVSLSHEGSISERASRSHEDYVGVMSLDYWKVKKTTYLEDDLQDTVEHCHIRGIEQEVCCVPHVLELSKLSSR